MPRNSNADRALASAVRYLKQFPLFPYSAWRYGLFRGGWFLPYLSRQRGRRPSSGRDCITDVMVAIVDHFEPAARHGVEAAEASVAEWCEAYEGVAEEFVDSDGVLPQHTWFYRAEYPNVGCVRRLSQSCYDGFGEIEFHLHHGFDTHESFRQKILVGLDYFNQLGAMITAEAQPRQLFAYIAGNWALDNGAGDAAKSGCNTELQVLREAGCYADFTFPAIGSHAQPRLTNTIYYATETPAPKSYDTGEPMVVGGSSTGDLLIFTGPVYMSLWRGVLDDAAIESFALPLPERLDRWQSAHVHVGGRPEWLFVKLHCHGIQSRNVFCGEVLRNFLASLSSKWKTDTCRLHFVTAREAYNIAKAAEAGKSGNAGVYRDFLIPKPGNRVVYSSRPYVLKCYSPDRIEIQVAGEGDVSIKVKLLCRETLAIRATMTNGLNLEFTRDGADLHIVSSQEVRILLGQAQLAAAGKVTYLPSSVEGWA